MKSTEIYWKNLVKQVFFRTKINHNPTHLQTKKVEKKLLQICNEYFFLNLSNSLASKFDMETEFGLFWIPSAIFASFVDVVGMIYRTQIFYQNKTLVGTL
jgi:hypothetical protein